MELLPKHRTLTIDEPRAVPSWQGPASAFPADPHLLNAWRRLAEDLERSLAAQEDVNLRLEETNNRIESQFESLRREIAHTRARRFR